MLQYGSRDLIKIMRNQYKVSNTDKEEQQHIYDTIELIYFYSPDP